MFRLFLCGDILNYEHLDGHICSDEIVKIIKSADFAICNFEAPICGYGTPQPKSGTHHHQCQETVEGLKSQGFDLLLLANNHIMDFGSAALRATLERANAAGLDTLGAGMDVASAYAPLIKVFGQLKVGFINAGEAQFGVIDYFRRSSSAGYAWVNHFLIDRTILRLKKECDCVIVFSHAGLENYSIPQKEWRERYRHFCDLGADVIVGSHPHVPQGYENYKNSLIFYSLGNFYIDSKNYKDKEDSSFAVWLEIGKGTTPVFEPIYHYKSGGKVRLSTTDNQVDLEKLCRLLGEDYEREHDQMSLAAYDRISQKFILSLAPLVFDGKLGSSMRRALSCILGRNKKINKELLQLHLLRNEAYFYAAKHALEVKVRRNYAHE